MTTAVTVIAPFYYPADTPLAVGATASLPDSLADQMVSAGKARYQTPRASDQTDLTADEVNLIRDVVSKEGNYALGSLAIDLLPNNTLTDTVTTQQQLAVATIPGGLFGPRSIIEVCAFGIATGANSKTFGFRAGAASGSMATATTFGGTGGIVAQGNVGVKALLWGNGTAGAQRASSNGPINWASANAASIVTLGIDTSLDWNIYAFVQFGTADAGDTFMVRPFWAVWVR